MPSPLPDSSTRDTDPIQGYSPAGQLLNLISGYWVAQAIYVATELGISDLLGKKPRYVDELAQQTRTHAPSLYRVLRALASVGIFSEDAPQSFVQTPMGALLRSDMPGNLAAFSRLQGDRWHWNAWGAIVDSVRSGKTAMSLNHDKANCFEYLADHQGPAKLFNAAMSGYASQVNAAVVDAYDFSNARVIVDVGGGHGKLLGSILEYAHQARGVLFDRPEVLLGATTVLQELGVADRCLASAGDFFQSVPAGGDFYVLSSVLHDWNDTEATAILRNVRTAMNGTGRLLVVEHVVPDGNEPHPGKFIDLEMMLVTGGKERTAAQYQSLLSGAGLTLQRLIPTAMSATVIEVQSA
jgi:O-methyltransferase domain/Dimerisation domain